MIKKSMEMLRLFILTLFLLFSTSGPVFSQTPTPTPTPTNTPTPTPTNTPTPTPTNTPTPGPTYTPTPVTGATPTPTPGGAIPVPFGSAEGYAILFGTTAILGIWFILRHKREE